MTITGKSQSFIDGQVARILAMIVAVLFGFFLYSNWSTEINHLFVGNAPTPVVSVGQPAKESNSGLTACLARRVGDVEQMKKEGILSDAQYAAFKGRAEDLCRVQNPG